MIPAHSDQLATLAVDFILGDSNVPPRTDTVCSNSTIGRSHFCGRPAKTAVAVMCQNGNSPGQYIVRVEVVDGEVVGAGVSIVGMVGLRADAFSGSDLEECEGTLGA